MSQKNKKVRIAAVGDIHFVMSKTEETKNLITRASKLADIILLCGDITNYGQEEEAVEIAKIFNTVQIPILAVLGNHDHAEEKPKQIKKILNEARVHFLEDAVFVYENLGFAGVKGFGGGFNKNMIASFGETATKKFVEESINETLMLERFLQSLTTPKIIVALHYAPIIETVVGEPEQIMPFLGNSRLSETLDRFNVRAVFHGHAHHGSLKGKTQKGIAVYNCSLPLLLKHGQKGFILHEE
ncbi:MAG: metallophosphoesterase [Candidatus Doudnabacteria bacterium]|nr:metallophosphoesterase [Candidatus Doudnabacteria bacterium]